MNLLNTTLLKAKYLECFGSRASTAATLRETVKSLVDRGVTRRTLIAWAMQTGCSKGHAANVLSQVLRALGLRKRRAGAGPNPSPQVLELLAHARAEYGESYLKVLRAARRLGKAHGAGRRSDESIVAVTHLHLEGQRRYHGSMIRSRVEQSRADTN